MKPAVLILCALTLAPLPAAAQGWRVYSYPEAGFAIQFPAAPTTTKGAFKTAAGASVPATTYALKQSDIVYSMIVADFSKTPTEEQAAIDEAVKAFAAQGEIKVDVTERINRQYGRQLSLTSKDGSRSNVSVFFVDHRLYELEGKALPPAESGSGKAIRFQQSLEFTG